MPIKCTLTQLNYYVYSRALMNQTSRHRLTSLSALTILPATLALLMPQSLQAVAPDGKNESQSTVDRFESGAVIPIDIGASPRCIGVTPGHIPITAHVPCLVLPSLLKPGTSDDQLKRQTTSGNGLYCSRLPIRSTARSRTSTGRVSSLLAHRVTLVGAKPSGTS